MRASIHTSVLSGFILFLFAASAWAQNPAQSYRMLPENSKLWVDGTSNNGDWTVFATEFSVELRMNQKATAAQPGLVNVTAKVPGKMVLSNKSVIMDRLVHNAFKTGEHPDIIYQFASTEVVPSGDKNFQLKTKGKLTLAGETRDIAMTVSGEILPNGNVQFKGSHSFAMSQYNIEPPTALFGRFRVADDVTVLFDLVMTPAG